MNLCIIYHKLIVANWSEFPAIAHFVSVYFNIGQFYDNKCPTPCHAQGYFDFSSKYHIMYAYKGILDVSK